jgi:hypothetical protein
MNDRMRTPAEIVVVAVAFSLSPERLTRLQECQEGIPRRLMLSVVMSSEGAEGSLRYRAKPCSQRSPFMRHIALQRGAMPPISAAADFNAAPPSSSRRCRVGRSLWKVLTFVGP